MDFTLKMRLSKRVERIAASRGFVGDIWADPASVPLVGTYSQQMTIATIGVDVWEGPMSMRDRELVNRWIRAAVLLSLEPEQYTPAPRPMPRRRRAW